MITRTQGSQLFRLFRIFSITAFMAIPSGCSRSNEKPVIPPVKLVISVPYSISGSLIFIAEKNGYFRDEGLEVELHKTASGVTAIDEIVKGTADLGAAAEFVFVNKNILHPDLRVITLLSRVQDLKLLMRRDRGFDSPADLRGKTIAFPKMTVAEYFFERFIDEAGVKDSQLKIVDAPPQNLQALLVEGKVDGVVVWNPIAEQIVTQMAGQVEVHSLQGEEPYHYILVGTDHLVKNHGKDLVRLIRALVRAEVFFRDNKLSGEQIIASALGIPIDTMARMLKESVAEVSLPRSLLLAMENQTRWLFGRTGSGQSIPNYLDRITLEPLKKANPDALMIIH